MKRLLMLMVSVAVAAQAGAAEVVAVAKPTRVKETEGLSVTEAAIEGFKQRFRSVQMTVLSFVIGVLPLLFASGAGANARHAVGVTTFWGMLAAAVVGLLFVPPLYVLVRCRAGRCNR